MAIPGAISTNSEATYGTGKYPREVVQMCAASCGCSESRKTYARSWLWDMGAAPVSTSESGGQSALVRRCDHRLQCAADGRPSLQRAHRHRPQAQAQRG